MSNENPTADTDEVFAARLPMDGGDLADTRNRCASLNREGLIRQIHIFILDIEAYRANVVYLKDRLSALQRVEKNHAAKIDALQYDLDLANGKAEGLPREMRVKEAYISRLEHELKTARESLKKLHAMPARRRRPKTKAATKKK